MISEGKLENCSHGVKSSSQTIFLLPHLHKATMVVSSNTSSSGSLCEDIRPVTEGEDVNFLLLPENIFLQGRLGKAKNDTLVSHYSHC